MADMPRPRPPYLHQEITRHGKVVWYVRVNKGPRIRLKAAPGTPDFQTQYNDALEGKRPTEAEAPIANTLAWLVARYRDSGAWAELSPATRRQRENILKQALAIGGREPLTAITPAGIEKSLERRSKTPAQARHFLDTMRGLFRYAVKAGLAELNPTRDAVARKLKNPGFPVWTDDEIEQFEKRWPIGTRERVMFDVFLYTGLRRGDAAMLGKQHVKNGIIAIDTEKTGTRVTIPVLPILAATLKAGPIGDLAYIATADGAPMKKESLGNAFREACRAAGIRKSAHGLRKAAATHAANQGATVAQLEAIFGWEGGRMASVYTRSADRKALALGAMGKLSRGTTSETSIPAPKGRVRAGSKKAKRNQR